MSWYTTRSCGEYERHTAECSICERRRKELNTIAEAQQLRPDFDDALAACARERGVTE